MIVGEVDGATRFRMLETVREFAADRLNSTGLRADAQAGRTSGRRTWSSSTRRRLFDTDEIAAVDELRAEENNLTDVLRRALRDGDRALVAQLLACLGALWTITGNHPRIFAIADAAEAALADWDPPAELRGAAQMPSPG